VWARLIHKRPVRGLMGPAHLVQPAILGRASRYWWLLGVVTYLAANRGTLGAPYVPNFALGTWLLLLPFFSCWGLLVQSAPKRFGLFAGYVQQALAARFKLSAGCGWWFAGVIFALGQLSA